MTDYIAHHARLVERLADLSRELSAPMGGFSRLHRKTMEDGALPARVKEMMALAVSVAIGCDGCIAYHAHDAVVTGASRPELLEAIAVGVLMGGGPGSIYATHALDAVDQLLPAEGAG